MSSYESDLIKNEKEKEVPSETVSFYIDRLMARYDELCPELKELAKDFTRLKNLEKTIGEEKSYKDMLVENIQKITGDMSYMRECLIHLEMKISGTANPLESAKKENAREKVEKEGPLENNSFSNNIKNILSKFNKLFPDLEELANNLKRPHDIEKTIEEEEPYKDILLRKIHDIKKDIDSAQECLNPLEEKIINLK